MRAQVGVVGGGPVGMLVAAELASHGVDTVVVEARRSISSQPKATVLHARALQCLARRGHLPGPGTATVPGARSVGFHFAGSPGLVITAPGTEPEPILKTSQPELEHHFESRARALGVQVLRGHRGSAISQDPAGVRITLEGPAGPTTCSVDYLVGADGAHGTVREQVGIASDTCPATISALAGVVRLEDPAALKAGWLRTARGWITVSRRADGDALVRTLNCSGAHKDRETPPSLEELSREVSWIAGRDIAMAAPRWLTRFSDFARLARTFRAGRVFLVGDAAHVHFPIGGQGLSTGVQDALNLGWKLALAVRGQAGPGLLDTYDLERRPAARAVIDNTRAQLALMRPVVEADALGALLGGLLAADRPTGYLGDMISAQDTVYPGHTRSPSAAEGTFLHNTELRTRTGRIQVTELLRDGRPLLLLFDDGEGGHQNEAVTWPGCLHVIHALPTPDVPHAALLVRPDGYIAWAPGAGGLADALAVYFTGEDVARPAMTASASCAGSPPCSAGQTTTAYPASAEMSVSACTRAPLLSERSRWATTEASTTPGSR